MKRFFLCCLAIILLSSCRKEREAPSWESGLLFPVFHAALGPGNFTGDSLLGINNDQSVDLVYSNRIYSLQPSELVDIRDTTVSNSYALPFSAVTLNPGQVIFNQTNQMSYSLDDLGLRLARIQSGKMKILVRSEIQERTVFTYSIPKALFNGQPFQTSFEVAAATPGQAATKELTFDLSGYSLDLSGLNGNSVNTFYSTMFAKIADDGSTVVVAPGDSLTMSTSFLSIIPEYVKGYFGQTKIDNLNQQVSVDFFRNVTAGSIDLEEVEADLTITNFIGAEAEIILHSLSTSHNINSSSVGLSHSQLGEVIHINRATDQNGLTPVNPSVYTLNLSSANSNITSVIENLPGSITINGEGILNPLGNVSGWNDFIHLDYGLNIDLDVRMPLQFAANGLTLTDTMSLDTTVSSVFRNVNEGNLRLFSENSFPFDLSLKLMLLDSNRNEITQIHPDGVIPAGVANQAGRVTQVKSSMLSIPLDEQTISGLKQAGFIVVDVVVNTIPTGTRLRIYSDYLLNLRLVADIDYQVRVK